MQASFSPVTTHFAATMKSANVTVSAGIQTAVSGGKVVRVATTAQWAVEPSYVPPLGVIIVYSDYRTVNGITFEGIKVGDGVTTVGNLQFVGGDLLIELTSHVTDNVRHITQTERESWNEKATVSTEEEELIIF